MPQQLTGGIHHLPDDRKIQGFTKLLFHKAATPPGERLGAGPDSLCANPRDAVLLPGLGGMSV